MIQEFVDRWEDRKEILRAEFKKDMPSSYEGIVRLLAKHVLQDEKVAGDYEDESTGYPNPEKIHEIKMGSYSGTVIFVLVEDGYSPSAAWYVAIDYGSCSGCDTLERIITSSDGEERQVEDLMTLALHIVQKLKVFPYMEG